ncbi:MAG TPA: phospholipase D-like domain-containing protein [Kofleriaceae bacterium]|jgi:phosphatidylserine/phosphatidylglycerophosphate/cardiolipin synthase-like enzyme
MRRFASIALALTVAASCVQTGEVEDGENDSIATDGKEDGGYSAAEVAGILSLVNDTAETSAKLRSDAGVTKRVADNITKHRDGATTSSEDDDKFDTLAELDAIPYVGPVTLNALLDAAKDKGLVSTGTGAKIDVIFSPQAAADSHNARIAQMIRGAQTSVDIAIYSYSDAGIAAALSDAVARGVKIRFLYEVAGEDKSITDEAARKASKSGKIEGQGIDVRYVNKILHHKILIVDGPRDDKSKVAKIAMGSANWSSTGATVYDENTMFIENSKELSAAYQAEFDKLWKGSRDFTGPAAAQGQSTAQIKPSDVPDEPGIDALFTSPNFKAGGADGSTWTVNKDSTVMANEWVKAINHAETSIHIASGHMRLRPVAEALLARHAAKPGLKIQVYLDQQEYISSSGNASQLADVDACVAAATTDAAKRDCKFNDFLFARELIDAGIDVRFKSFAYRWDATYAAQMHSKYMVVDGKELLSGSYNLSMNSEQGTFENALHVTGAQFAPLLASFEGNFGTIWETGRAQNLLSGLKDTISTSATIPLTFPPMSLTAAEFESLKTLIRANCTTADSDEFRNNPASHKTCAR